MSFKYIKALTAFSLFAASAIVSATPLNDYNLILSGDFKVSGGSGHIEGSAFIGGNVVNGSVFAQHVDKNSTADTVKVLGNFTGNNAMHIEAGHVAYGGSLVNVPLSQDWCNGNGINNNAQCFHQVTDGSLAAEKTDLLAELANESSYYSSLATSTDFTIAGDSNNKTFTYTGAATDLAVFNISATDLSNLNWNLSLGNAANVLINVTGTVFNAGNAHVNGFQSDANNVLWNFADALNLNFGDSWYGSILALNATINTNSNLNGAIAAASYVGNGEIHDYHWSYTPPTTSVPEPSALWLSVLGLALVLVGRTRRKH